MFSINNLFEFVPHLVISLELVEMSPRQSGFRRSRVSSWMMDGSISFMKFYLPSFLIDRGYTLINTGTTGEAIKSNIAAIHQLSHCTPTDSGDCQAVVSGDEVDQGEGGPFLYDWHHALRSHPLVVNSDFSIILFSIHAISVNPPTDCHLIFVLLFCEFYCLIRLLEYDSFSKPRCILDNAS